MEGNKKKKYANLGESYKRKELKIQIKTQREIIKDFGKQSKTL